MTTAPRVEHTPFSPRFASAWAALTYTVCALSLAWPAVMGRFLVQANSDQFRAGYSFREFAATYLREHGSFPLWNPYLQGGMPYVAAMHGDIFYPTFLLRLVMPIDAAMSWGMIGHFFLCGMAMYWFLRVAARMTFFGALAGGVAYMMAGFVASLLSAGHDGKLFVNALFPLTLLVITWAMRDAKRWAWGVLAIIVGLAGLTPHPQLTQYLLLGTGAWALFLAFGGKGADAMPRNTALTRLGLALGSVIVGAAITTVQYLPVAEYTPWSPRANGKDWDFATSFSFPIEELLNAYLPQFSGILNDYWGRNWIHFHSEYAGVVVLMLAGAAFGAATTDSSRRFFRFWLGVAVVSLVWALGGSTPFYQLIYNFVPGTKFFRAPSTMYFITTFAMAVFAAIGMERALAGRISRRYVMGWGIGAGVITLLALSGALTTVAQSLVKIPQFVDRPEAGATALKLGSLRSLAFVVLTGAVLLALTRGKLRGWQGGAILVAMAAFDLWTVERVYWGSVRPASQIFATDATIEYLKQVKEPFRVFTFEDPSRPAGADDPYLGWDGLMVHRIRTTYGYHGNQIGRYQLFEEREMMFNPTTWAITNTRFLLVNNDSVDIPGGKRVVGPVPNSAGTLVSLYQLPGENPFAWVAPAIVKYPENQTVEALRQPNFPVRSVALVDPGSATAGVSLTAIPAPLATTVSTTSYAPGKISLALSAPAPAGSALVVSENFYPGWSAMVDGKPVTAERMNLVLIGVALPAGAQKVELSFTSRPYEQGKTITLVALAVAVLAMLAGMIPFGPGGGGTRVAAEQALAAKAA